ncbi:hypothetical protein [Pseudoduganella rhizocola]|uniref:hypothetical protein n=1 Tax=Pseudoduganella rhizocola TaxID=3382643 RepID=UPI0038B62F5B
MASITLVVPFGLPPAEFAADLVRAAQAPALAALLSRCKTQAYHAFDVDSRVLPHEGWLAQHLNAPGAGAPLAAAVMQGYGAARDAGHWFLMHPIHVQAARNHLVMQDRRALQLGEAESRTLFDAIEPFFAEDGKQLVYGDAQTWFMRADDWAGLATASPDAAAGSNMAAWMPAGDAARSFRRLQNEVQMLWHSHPVNAARQERGLPAVNSFWLWAGATAPAPAPNILASVHAPDWLAALAAPALRNAAPDQLLAAKGGAAALCHLLPAGLSGDWSEWLLGMEALDKDWFAPMLGALRTGKIDELALVFSHRDGWSEFRTGKMSLRQFWRPLNLKKLLP